MMASWSRLLVLALVAVARPAAAAAPTCAELFVPEELHLVCRAEQGPGAADWRLVVEPTDPALAPLTQLGVRPITEPVDDPAAWLQDRLRLGLREVRSSLQLLLDGADNPIAGSRLNDEIKNWLQLTDFVDDALLAGCQEPELRPGTDRWQMACRWGLGEVELQLVLRLDGGIGERHLTSIHAMTERRLRHLLAIANSL